VKLKKRKAIDIDGHLHLLTFTVYRRVAALEDRRCAQLFVESLARAREELGFKLLAYVVMPEHVHLLLQPKPGCRVAQILRAIKQPASNRILRYLKETRPTYSQRFLMISADGKESHRFWQAGGGHDRNVVSDAVLRYSLDYIHCNPIRRGLCTFIHQWEFSSALAYCDEEGEPPISVDWLD